MTAKQQPGLYSKDGSKYGTVTNGAGTLVTVSTSTTAGTKKPGSQAKDGSIYFTITNGQGTLA